MKRWCALLLLVGLLASCRYAAVKPSAAADVRLFVESREPGGTEWTLPVSGVRIACRPSPAVDSTNVADLDVVTLELGRALLLQLTPRGVADLTAELAGTAKRIVLVVNRRAIGVVRLAPPIRDGRILLFVEISESELPDLVTALKPSLGHRP